MALALDTAGLQKILHQLEHGDDMAALLGVVFIGRQELGKHQDDRGEQTFRRIVEKSVLAAVAVITVWIDDGLGQDFGVFLGLGTGRKIVRVIPGNVHIPVDQRQQIVSVRAGGISQVDN